MSHSSFSLEEIEYGLFESGNMCGQHNQINGMQTMIMQSAMSTDILIKAFRRAIDQGYNPDDVKDNILKHYNIKENELMENDIRRLISEVKGYCRTRRSFFI